jgi:hypothetical protein
MHVGKEEVKLSLFAGDIVLYLKDPRDFTRILLDLMNTVSKVQDTESTYKSQ